MVWCCHSWYSWLIVAFLQYFKIFGVVFIVVVRVVAIWVGIPKAVKIIKSRILVFSVRNCVYAVDNARQDGDRGEGTLFDEASCTEVEETVGTLKVSCWSEVYSWFCV